LKNKLNKFEFEKYENVAKKKLIDLKQNNLGFENIPLYLMKPYLDYGKTLIKKQKSNGKILEIGSGTGNFTNHIFKTKMYLIASDISPASLKYLKERYKNKYKFQTKIANMEALPFKDNYFDIVCGVGFLSYGNNNKTKKEIYRVLKKDGYFICVDSLNNNFIYSLNRILNYIKKKTSLNTIKNMPNINLIENYINSFSKVDIFYYGSIVWLMPIISLICGEKRASKLLERFDKLINVKKSAFRFLLIAKK